MSTEFKALLLGWVVLGMIVIFLAIYRRTLAKHQDIGLHVMDADASLVPQQANVAQKLEQVDRWGKTLTVVEVVYGLVIAAMYLYAVWTVNTKTFWSE